MKTAIISWLNEPIPRKKALGVVSFMFVNQGIMYAAYNHLEKHAKKRLDDANQKLTICNETIDFMLARADPVTLGELNQHLDFWRVVRGKSVRPDED
jgi:hypothetical protein